MKIVVIGAGLAGLTAAHRLHQAGHEVEVIETNSHPGGRCHVLHRDGYIIDLCPEFVATSYRRYLNLVHEAGLDNHIVKTPSVVSVLKNGRLMDIDMGNLMSVAFTPVLSWGAKLRLVWGAFGLREQLRAVPAYLPDNISLDDQNSNAEAMSLKAFGREVTEHLIEPILRPIAGVTMDLLSTALVPYTLAEWKEMVTLRGGLNILPVAVAANLKVRYKTTVKRVHSNAADVRIEYIDASGAPGSMTADKCLITAPYDQAEDMYPRFAEIGNNFRKHMQFMRMLDVKLAYSKRPPSKAAMVMMTFKENPLICTISLSHNKSPDRTPAGHSLFSIFTEHKDYDNMAAKSDDEVVKIMREQTERLYPELKGHFLFSVVGRQPRTSYVPDPGYFHRAKRLWDAVGREPRVHLAGDVIVFGGLESAVASGERAAERLIKGH